MQLYLRTLSTCLVVVTKPNTEVLVMLRVVDNLNEQHTCNRNTYQISETTTARITSAVVEIIVAAAATTNGNSNGNKKTMPFKHKWGTATHPGIEGTKRKIVVGGTLPSYVRASTLRHTPSVLPYH